MQRLNLSTLRPRAMPAAGRAARSNIRNLSNFRPNVLQMLEKQRASVQPLFKFKFPRYSTDSPIIETVRPISWRRIALLVGGVAGTVVILEGTLNRQTNLTRAERSLLNISFGYTGIGMAITAATAFAIFKSGAAYRIMAAHPWTVFGWSLVGGLGSLFGVLYTPLRRPVRNTCGGWCLFNAVEGSPIFFLNPALVARVGLYTLGVVGALSYTAATATNDKYLRLGGPLLAGLSVVTLSSLSPLVLPATAVRTLASTEFISLYGGLAIFGGYVLYDTQRILEHAREIERGLRKFDPINEAIGLQLDIYGIL
ncbi:Bax Inhibitor family protein [Mycena sanguinolenta]|uniref:Bax Inhibitor family protein n=1 Tax=Mycena sanguinolenta TaxID=230812 RepID=A0A8H7CHK9_9AGAR|nr:Bax Inhibitor family protein [Mycena sanguinolenta]